MAAYVFKSLVYFLHDSFPSCTAHALFSSGAVCTSTLALPSKQAGSFARLTLDHVGPKLLVRLSRFHEQRAPNGLTLSLNRSGGPMERVVECEEW